MGSLTVGFAGLGRMGHPMALRLVAAGHDVLVWNRSCSAADSAADAGARRVATPSDLCEAPIIVTMLAGPEAVQEVYFGAEGILSRVRSGTVLMDMSTIGPDAVAEMDAAAGALGCGVIDAPVSGSVVAAESGTLTVLAGGSEADLRAVDPVLDVLASNVLRLGPVGAGAAMKLAINALLGVLNQGLAEALVLAERHGIDRELAYDAIASSAVAAPYVTYKRQAFLDPAGAPAAFSLVGLEKDLRLAVDRAEAVALAVPVTATAVAQIRHLLAEDPTAAVADLSIVAEAVRRSGAS